MAPVLELGLTHGHGYSLQAVMLFSGSVQQKPWFQQTNTVVLVNFSCFWCSFLYLSLSLSLSLSLGAVSPTVFLHFLLRGTRHSCFDATSVLNKFFKNGVKIEAYQIILWSQDPLSSNAMSNDSVTTRFWPYETIGGRTLAFLLFFFQKYAKKKVQTFSALWDSPFFGFESFFSKLSKVPEVSSFNFVDILQQNGF